MSTRPTIIAVCGGTQTGKTTYVREMLKRTRPRRLMIWDPDGEYQDLGYTTATGAELATATAASSFAVVLKPTFQIAAQRDQFNGFCAIALGRAAPDRPLTVVADELADVVLPGYSPPYWSVLVRRGLKRGVTIVAISQRPSSMDKTFWSLAHQVRCTALAYREDQRTMADALGMPLDRVAALRGYQDLKRDIFDQSIN